MRWVCAVAVTWMLGCSVYDDGLIHRVGSTRAGEAMPGDGVASTGTAGNAAAGGAVASNASPGLGPDGQPTRGTGVTPAADGGVACVVNPSRDYCAELPALTAVPVIDGTLECGLSLSEMPSLGWKGPNLSPDKRASYAAAWHHDGMYVYVEVHGQPLAPHPATEPPFCGDAVELYVDADAQSDDAGTYDAMGTMQFVIAAPSLSGSMEAARYTQGNPQGAWISKSLKVSALADGYSVEAFITAADLGLWQWTPSAELGFSVAIDVAIDAAAESPSRAGCTAKSGQFFLRLGDPRGGCPGEPWCDASAFCRAVLRD